MPPHTIRLPPLYRSCSAMAQFAYLSPPRRQLRRRLSSISSRNRDSSVKSTAAHCWLVHRRFCLVRLACLCLWESGTPRSPSSKSSAVKSIPHGLNRHFCSSKRRTTARTSLKTGIRVSVQTVRNRLHSELRHC